MSWLMSRHSSYGVAVLSYVAAYVVVMLRHWIILIYLFPPMSRHWCNWLDTLHTISLHCSSGVATLLPLHPFLLFLLLFCLFSSNFCKT